MCSADAGCLAINYQSLCEDRVLDGPASGGKGSKDKNYLDCTCGKASDKAQAWLIRSLRLSGAACMARVLASMKAPLRATHEHVHGSRLVQ